MTRSAILDFLSVCFFIAQANRSNSPAPLRYSTPTPVVVAPSVPPVIAVPPVSESESPVAVPPIVAVPSVSESEPPVAVPPVSESGPRPAPVPSTVAGVMPVDEFSRLLIVEAPAPLLGESHIGQRHVDDHRQRGNQQSEPQRSESEHRILLP